MANAQMPVWQAEGDQKRTQVRKMFAAIAPTYDRCNALMSLRLHHRWRAFAVRQLRLQPGHRVLDLCSGTGDFLIPLREAVGPQGQLVAMDFCAPMLEQAPQKDAAATLSLADAGLLPARSGVFDAVSVGWGIRNVPDIDAAHREIARVLKPGGRFVSLDMAVPRSRVVRFFSDLFTRKGLPILGAWFGQKEAYTYLPESTQRFLDREGLKQSMEKAGFARVRYFDLFFGNICVHVGEKEAA